MQQYSGGGSLQFKKDPIRSPPRARPTAASENDRVHDVCDWTNFVGRGEWECWGQSVDRQRLCLRNDYTTTGHLRSHQAHTGHTRSIRGRSCSRFGGGTARAHSDCRPR
ncbi:hypothetical protein WJX75_008034 [Coccomyxa subellipsoidea]|uniref:Uncharacterized protein n=1 Tax=Coccomyxa subellipsoidea TaxID=248742 RepID=A0ABR2YIF5_9CHLO